ncbi:deoxynucleoside kinase [Candidatus Harpocratesius sp.]
MRSKQNGYVFSLAGVHGVGKTTIYEILKTKFSEFHNIRLYPERLRSVPPVPFGSKNKQTAFRAELHYQQQMIERNRLVEKFVQNQRDHIAILDRSPLSTLVYALALNLPKIDYELIYDTYNSVSWQKDYIIYLYAEPKTVMNRIYRRGSLDPQREKWNEDDFKYLLRVLNKYSEIFENFKLVSKKRLIKVNTEKNTPHETVEQIIQIISEKSGIRLRNISIIPNNQKKLTHWLNTSLY